jgi:hypothetical protein
MPRIDLGASRRSPPTHPASQTSTRIALKTKGTHRGARSSAALEAARLDDPRHIVVLGTNGYAPAPHTLERS